MIMIIYHISYIIYHISYIIYVICICICICIYGPIGTNTQTHTHVITVIFKNSYIHISTIMYHTVMILAPASSSWSPLAHSACVARHVQLLAKSKPQFNILGFCLVSSYCARLQSGLVLKIFSLCFDVCFLRCSSCQDLWALLRPS